MFKFKKYFKILIIFLTLFSFKLGFNETIHDLLKSNYAIKFDELLGKGGSGEIWGSSSSNIAIKGGNSKRACEIINKEFEIQKKIYNEIIKINGGLLERLKILNPNKIISNSSANVCAMELPRLYPIKEELNPKLVTQMRLGEESLDQIEKDEENIIKGHAIGLQEVENIVSKYPKTTDQENIQQLFADIGTFLGMLHYKIKLDGLDSEVCLVRSTPDAKKYEIFFIDFGMCNNITYKTNKKKLKAQEKIITALTVEKIFPNPTNNNFKFFLNSYLKVAKTENLKSFAKETIHKFIKNQYVNNILIKEYLIETIGINQRRSFQIKGYTNIISDWIGNKLINKIIENDYNQPKEELKTYINDIMPKIIVKRDKVENKSKIEISLLNKIETIYKN